MTDYSRIAVAAAAVLDPSTSAKDLSIIAQEQRYLWSQIASHPNVYPALLDWLDKYGDADVHQAVAKKRSDHYDPVSSIDAGSEETVPIPIPLGVPRDFCAIRVARIADQDYPYAYAVTDEAGNLVGDPWDGQHQIVHASELAVERRPSGGKWSQVLRQHNTDIAFIVTDCRTVTYCRDFDAGARSGDAANNPFKASQVLLGQIRYEWLLEIAYGVKSRIVWMVYRDRNKNLWRIVLRFNPGIDVAGLANDVLWRASNYRLSMIDEKDDEEMAFLTHHAGGGLIPLPKEPQGEVSIACLPTSYHAPAGEAWRPVFAETH